MSSISASSIGQNVLQYLQQLTTESTSATTDAATTTDPTTTSTTAAPSHHHHHHGSKIKEIQDAVTSALENAKDDGDTTDPNKIVQTAIEQVLGSANNATTSATSATTSTPGTAQSAFAKTLQSFGVDADQFRSDFLSAVKEAQNGDINTSSVFAAFPTGTQLDTNG